MQPSNPHSSQPNKGFRKKSQTLRASKRRFDGFEQETLHVEAYLQKTPPHQWNAGVLEKTTMQRFTSLWN
jgi:hypothetical protein